jgi:hypothetical protein
VTHLVLDLASELNSGKLLGGGYFCELMLRLLVVTATNHKNKKYFVKQKRETVVQKSGEIWRNFSHDQTKIFDG